VGAFRHVRVLDCTTGVAGPLAAMLLADHGADVIRVEPPGGDPGRADPGHPLWNRGKRAVALDLEHPSGREDLARLLAGADVCAVSGGLSSLTGTALDPQALAGANPTLVVLHVPPYLDEAPWAGGAESDALLSALTGAALRQGSTTGAPVDDVYPHLLVQQGLWAAAAVAAALVERQGSGRGQVVTVAGIHGVMVAAAGGFNFDASALSGSSAGRAQGAVPYYRLYRCGDGEWLFLAALIPRFTELAFGVLGVADLLTDERLGQRPRAAMLSPEHSGWVTERIAEAFLSRPRDEWLDAFAAAGCPVGPVWQREAWLDHPQLAAIGMRVELDDPQRGPVVVPGDPVVLTATPASASRPAPAVPAGEAIGWADRPDVPPAPAGSGSGRGGPLAGVRVLDLGAIIAGPFAASLLGALGAEVVKVEPLAGDSFRGPGFAAYNRGQRSVALDLSDERGRQVLLALVETADVVVDNYRPGVLGRLRIGYDDLCLANPEVVTVTITGFGEGGPLGNEPGFDPVLQAMSGMMAAQGGDDEPVFFTVPVNDVAAAAAAAFGACAALFHRRRGGGGQRVWTSLAGMSALVQGRELARYRGRPPAPSGGRDHPGSGPLDRFHPVSDGWVRIQADGDEEDAWARLEQAGLVTVGTDAGARDRAEALARSLAGMPRDSAVNALNRAGVAAAAARRTAELTADPALAAYRVLEPDRRPGREGWWTAGPPARFSRTPLPDLAPAPGLAEHSIEVLGGAGLGEEEIRALVDAGVLGVPG